MTLEEVGWMVFVLVGIAWWNINRAIRRWAEVTIARIDALEGRLARIEGNTATLGEALKGG